MPPACSLLSQRSSWGHVFLLHIRVIYTSQAAFLSLRRGVRWCDTDRPPCPVLCLPMSPYENQAVNLFLTRYKKGGQPVLSPVTVPLIKAIVVTSALVLACIFLSPFLLSVGRFRRTIQNTLQRTQIPLCLVCTFRTSSSPLTSKAHSSNFSHQVEGMIVGPPCLL